MDPGGNTAVLPFHHMHWFVFSLTLCLHFHLSSSPLYFLSLQTCSRILLQHSETLAFLDILHRPSLSALARKGLSKKINEKCRKVSRCPHSHAINGQYF